MAVVIAVQFLMVLVLVFWKEIRDDGVVKNIFKLKNFLCPFTICN